MLALVGTRLFTGEDMGVGGVFGELFVADVSLRRRPIDNLFRKVPLTGVRRPSEFEDVLARAKALVKKRITSND